jgi:hypothetical protein
VLIAADDALKSTVSTIEPRYFPGVSQVAERKFRMAIDLLSDFAKDFPPKDSTSDPNIGGTVTGEVKMSVKVESPLMILQALKNDLHSNVNFHLYLYLSTLMDTSQCAIIHGIYP